ncbi:ATP-binding cassette domain-containing protein [Lentibacillus sp. CBA3610]|uniref:ATP-binding cassette domain-containing protein n=1 Tax=Lentibacillus sp. CBA3610 TaxID=2518176 RepID=UPI001595646C|nr:ABC transporter ATP-binding protein [Lentibacillus sp. CBA3610]QKY70609.1 ABC transporter ATP-binding protein [Lentibacillus sp. CBA3610]
MEAFAEISELKKQIDDFRLGPIDLTIEPGTINALVGNNGSGKSTLIKLMMDLATPDSGHIKIFRTRTDTSDETWKTKVAYLPQTPIGYNPYTGKDLKAITAPMYPDWDDEVFAEIAGKFHLPLDKKYGKLSQGMQQKLSLALTIPRNAPILILDEPTSFMDIPSKELLMDILTRWMDQGERTIIMASHQAADIMKLTDYLFVLQDGRMNGVFEKDTLVSSYKQYWLSTPLPNTTVPGEITRENQHIISNQPEQTEAFFRENHLPVTNRAALDLEEIIGLLLRQP